MARHGFPRWLSRLVSGQGSRRGAHEKQTAAQLEIESLEPRCVLTTGPWVPLDLVTAPSPLDPLPQGGAEFGHSIAIDGDTMVVGAPFHDHAPSNVPDDLGDAGAAYVFTRDDKGTADVSDDAWILQTTLTASDPETASWFGYSVAISGDTIVIGSNLDDDGGINSGSSYVFVRSGTDWSQQAKLTASDRTAYDEFGFSVAISGDTIVIGSIWDDDGGTDSGSSYVFVRSGTDWIQQAKITASDRAADDEFGGSVAIFGDTIVVGSSRDDDGGTNSGSSYVFVRSGTDWSQQAKITANDREQGDRFGSSVAIFGDTILVGSPGEDDGGSQSGASYVFVRSGTDWSQQAKITASDAAAGDGFGTSGAISGDTIVVGSDGDDGVGLFSGSSYVFVRSGTDWSQQAKITASDPSAGGEFGYSVATDGDTIVVGSYRDDDGGPYSGSSYVFVRSGSVWTEQDKVVATRGPSPFTAQPSADFGETVAIEGDTMVVGASGHQLGGFANAGVVYVYTRDDRGTTEVTDDAWLLQATLTASNPAAQDLFGYSVALSGDTIVVGSQHDDDDGSDSGSAYVFVRNGTTWTEQAKLKASDAAAGDNFGRAVAISGDTIVVGSIYDDDGATSSGSSYVFVRNGSNWTEQAKLKASDPAANDNFGSSTAIEGDTIVVGSYWDDHDGGSNSGSSYVFVRNGSNWTEQAKLTASDAAAGDFFGFSLAIDGDTIVVGSYLDDDGGTNSGSAYVFVRNGSNWTEQAKLTASDPAAYDFFGNSVAIEGDTIVIGSRLDDDNANDSGSAYVFVRSGSDWREQAKLTASDPAAEDYFGRAVAIYGETIIVGSDQDDGEFADSGSVSTFVFKDSTPPTVVTQNITVYLDETGNASITPANIDNGSSDVVGIASLVLDITSFTGADLGVNTVTLTATDTSGNESSATASVTVVDNIAPMIIVPSDIVAEATSISGAAVEFEAMASDNVDTDVAISYSVDGVPVTSGATFAVGVHIVTVQAVDDSGNESFAEFTITVARNPETTVTHWIHVTSQGASLIEIMDAETGEVVQTIDPFPGFQGGLNVASGDLDGDGISEIVVGAKGGGGPHVKVYNSDGVELRSFFAYDPAFTGGVTVAIGDINDDGWGDIITGAGAGGGPHVKVFSGLDGSVLQSFYAFDPAFTGGVNVAAGDVNADDHADIIVGAGAGGGPHVKVFSGSDQSLLASFFAYEAAFAGGVHVAAGDVNGDQHADIITGAGSGGGPHVKVFDGSSLNMLQSFFAFDSRFAGGVHVAAGDVDGDDLADIITSAGPGGGPHVRAFSGLTGTELASYFAYEPTMTSGVQVVGAELHSGEALRAYVGVRPSTAAALTSTVLTNSVTEALYQLESAGLTQSSYQFLSGLAYEIVDLPGTLLAQYVGNLIRVDVNAAGHGWWTELAWPDSAQIDLLTTLVHEFGHALGLDHSDDPHDLMAETLHPGVRKADWAEIVERVFAQG